MMHFQRVNGLCLGSGTGSGTGSGIFSQKLTSWVFNDQPCECADVGHSRKIGRAAKMGWEKILLRAIMADLAPRIRFYLHKEFRAAGIRFLSTQRIGGGDLEENGHFH